MESSSVSKQQDLFMLVAYQTAQRSSRNAFSSALYIRMLFPCTQWVFSGGRWWNEHEVRNAGFPPLNPHFSRKHSCRDIAPGGPNRLSLIYCLPWWRPLSLYEPVRDGGCPQLLLNGFQPVRWCLGVYLSYNICGPFPINKNTPLILSEESEEGFQIPATITERYKVGRTIGDGNFAVVKECVER